MVEQGRELKRGGKIIAGQSESGSQRHDRSRGMIAQ